MRLGSIADDYTGAADLASSLAACGLRTALAIGVPRTALPEADAVVVALKTRAIAADLAVSQSRAAAAWLRDHGAAHILFKICSTFDSTDAGNIGPVTDALLADMPSSAAAVVMPAFPRNGRTVYRGHLFVGNVLLSESPLKDHPLNPMRDSNLARVLGRQSHFPVGSITLDTVEKGEDAILHAMRCLHEDGYRTVIVDAVADRHLQAIGAAALQNAVSVGASGLGFGIAKALLAKDQDRTHPESWRGCAEDGYAAILAGSCSQATLQQIAAMEDKVPILKLSVAQIAAGAPVAAEAVSWAAQRLPAGPVLITSSEAAGARSIAGIGQTIEATLAEIAAGLVERGVRRMVVAGGETSGAIVDRLKISAFLVGPEIAPGVPVLRTTGAAPEMMLALKSGNFGGVDFFERALRLMK